MQFFIKIDKKIMFHTWLKLSNIAVATYMMHVDVNVSSSSEGQV